MNILNRLKIRKKLIIGFGIIFFLLTVISVISYINIQRVIKQTKKLDTLLHEADRRSAAMFSSAQWAYPFFQESTLLVRYLQSDNIDEQRLLFKKFEETGKDFQSSKKELESYMDSPEEKEKFKLISNFQQLVLNESIKLIAVRDGEGEYGQNTKEAVLKFFVTISPFINEIDDLNNIESLRLKDIQADAQKASMDVENTGRRVNIIILTALFAGLIIGISAAFLIGNSITQPINNTMGLIKAIAEGRGDLTQRLKVNSNDEVGIFSLYFNKFIEGMQDMVRGIFVISGEVASTSSNIRRSSEYMHKSTQTQLKAIEESSSSTVEVAASIKAVSNTTNNLLASTEMASSSVQEMTASIGEVSNNAERLSLSVEETSSAIIEMVASIKEVASHAEILFEKAEEMASSIMQINGAVKEIEGYSKEQASLASKVRGDATGLGMEAIKKTSEGIENIKEEVTNTASIIHILGSRSNEIGKILNVIDDVAKAINLLALNASILASQAGEHGKGFAVVANEIKRLANNTAESTKEITNLITGVQGEVKKAVDSMERSLIRVEEGVQLSMDAHDTLSKISDSANLSVDMAKRIENATIEQSNGASLVAEGIQSINNMVKDIKRATAEQFRASEEIVKATEGMRIITKGVQVATSEQASGSKHINQIVIEIVDRMKIIASATHEEMVASDMVVKAIETIKIEAENNTQLASELDSMVKSLDTQSILLKERMEGFKI